MPFITLTTDLGKKDFYLPALKAYLAVEAPGIVLHDISHEVAPFNMVEAAFIVKSCYQQFPAGSIHLIGVEGDFSEQPRYILAKIEEHYFLAKDSGVISLITEAEPSELVLLDIGEPEALKFPQKEILAKAAVALARGADLNQLGSLGSEMERRLLPRPQINRAMIRGQVAFIDSYGNAISNIHRHDFPLNEQERGFSIHYSRFESSNNLVNSYHAVPEGEIACLFGWHGYLEIGINGGNGSSLLSLPVGKNILIEFD